jgi:hypothetical protein
MKDIEKHNKNYLKGNYLRGYKNLKKKQNKKKN